MTDKEPRNIPINAKLTATENERLRKYSDFTGVPMARLIRDGIRQIINGDLGIPWKKETYEAFLLETK